MNEKIENALNESRILVLVAQVIVGFQYQTIFQPGFDPLPAPSRYLHLGALGLMLLALVLVISPVAFLRLVARGDLSQECHRFITRVTTPALLPFAVGLGIEFYVVGSKLLGMVVGIVSGVLACLVALFFWYGLEEFARHREPQPSPQEENMETPKKESSPLKERIKFVLTEARVVLPGAQALLGFQFAAVFTESFDKLTVLAKTVHFASIVAIAVCTILLMAPAAYHRIAERGRNTERLHTFAGAMILSAMAFLALGIAGDTFVVVEKVLHTAWLAGTASALVLLVYYGWWFGYMFYRRSAGEQARHATQTKEVTV